MVQGTADDFFAEEDEFWNSWVKLYLRNLLEFALKHLHDNPKVDFDKAEGKDAAKYISDSKIILPGPYSPPPNNTSQTDTAILPLSFENNGSIPGTLAILKDLSSLLNIKTKDPLQLLAYYNISLQYDLNKSRQMYELQLSQNRHKEIFLSAKDIGDC